MRRLLFALACALLAGALPAGAALTSYGPAFRVKGLRPVYGGERLLTAAWGGKLVLAAAAPSDSPAQATGLWITDGTEAGTRLLRANLQVARGAYMGDPAFVPFGGVLYFGGREWSPDIATFPSGIELWRTDGTPEGTWQVTDLNPGSADAAPSEITVARGALYFVAGYGGVGDGSHFGLFRSDGTGAGTTLVAQLEGQVPRDHYPLSPVELTAAGPNLFLQGRVPGRGIELHKVIPCASAPARDCVVLVKDLSEPAPAHPWGSSPQLMVALGDAVIFAADAASGRGLYRSDGTDAGTTLLTLTPYLGNSSRERLSISAGGLAYLLAYGQGLWRTDGTPAGTELLAQEHATWQYWMTSAAGVVYFFGGDYRPATNDWGNAEPWRTDGTATGTHPLRDICPGPCSSGLRGVPPLALEPEGRLFFEATEGGGYSGAGLWTSDGTEAGTVPVQGFSSITDVNRPWDLTRAGDLVYFGLSVPGPNTAWSGVYDSELWAVRVDLADRTPPDLSCPAAVVVEASGPGGGRADFAVSARDNMTPDVPALLSATPGWFPLGSTLVEASATDGAGNTGVCRFTVQVRDTRPPAVACPPDLTAEAISPEGAPVTFAAAALDAVSGAVVTSDPAPGSVFPPGTSAVVFTAKDQAGNEASCAFTVTVRDTRAPLLVCPAFQVLEATSPDGAPGGWPDAIAVDLVSAATASYAPARGAPLALGSHAVVATATDAANNRATCGFTVLVQDTIAPAVTCPAGIDTTASGASGAVVAFAAPVATDAATSTLVVEVDRASGSLFPVGVTLVRATSRDAAGNEGSCTFSVTVREAPLPAVPPVDPPVPSSGCSTGGGGAFSLLASLALLGRRRSGRRG